MGYFGPEPAPGDLELVEQPDEACFVCSIRLKPDDRGVVVPHLGQSGRDHVSAHLSCWRLLIRREV